MKRRRLLIVAFHFPPLQGSTGILRTLSFARYLSTMGWEVAVLTTSVNAYPEISKSSSHHVPDDVKVIRAFALDTRRHLSIFGRYPRMLSMPDRWASWIPFGVLAGLRWIKRWQPDVMMSTYPIPSAHVIALALKRITGVPWVADFRDPMAQERYPADQSLRGVYRKVEAAVFRRADRATVTTEGTARMYRERYTSYVAGSIAVVPNGFDDESIDRAIGMESELVRSETSHMTLIHSGLLDPRDRNPGEFLRALAEMREEGFLERFPVRVVFRAAQHEDDYAGIVAKLRLGEVVSFQPTVPYEVAIREMVAADACLLFQASNCNEQIPAKLYEYLYAGRPIAAMTDVSGESAKLLKSLGYESIAQLDDATDIKRMLVAFLPMVAQKNAYVAPRQVVMTMSRRGSTERLDQLLREMVGSR